MWFCLFTTVLVLAATFYQGLQGLFSALITCILTIMSAALAFGVYENVYRWQLMAYLPDEGRAVALVAIFVISLLVLQLLFDALITGNLQFPLYVDRVGGGLFGFATAMTIIGVLAIGFQMLPFGPALLGFERYAITESTTGKPVVPFPKDKDAQKNQDVVFRDRADWSNTKLSRNDLWLRPDGFTIALISHLSDNALQGQSRLSELYPDFLDSLHYARDGSFRESLAAVSPDSVRVEKCGYLPDTQMLYTLKPGKQGADAAQPQPSDRKPAPGSRRMVIRVSINEPGDRAEDKQYLHFTTQQVRLFAHERTDGPVRVFALAGINDEAGLGLYVELFPAQDVQRKRESAKTLFDFVFEVPDKTDFQPWFVEYKETARAEILPTQLAGEDHLAPIVPGKAPTETEKGTDTPAPPTGPPGSGEGPNPKAGGPAGRVHGFNIDARDPVFSNKLPFALTEYVARDREDGPGGFAGGHIIGPLDTSWKPKPGNERALNALDVPADKRMLQLFVDKLHAESWLGQLLAGMKDKTKNIGLIASGQTYLPDGAYVMAAPGGQPTFELIYMHDYARQFARLPDFDRIKNSDLVEGQSSFVFLFLLPPGARVEKFHTGNKDIDLTNLNLVAPQ